MVRKALTLITLSLLITTGTALAHGVNVETVIKDEVVIVKSSYSPTQPVADASVTIYSPSDLATAWQTGRTDRSGNFAFVPDAEGDWTFVVDDRKGHMQRIVIVFRTVIPEEKEITEDEIVEPAQPTYKGLSNTYRIIIGLSIIFGITGIFYGIKARQGAGRK